MLLSVLVKGIRKVFFKHYVWRHSKDSLERGETVDTLFLIIKKWMEKYKYRQCKDTNKLIRTQKLIWEGATEKNSVHGWIFLKLSTGANFYFAILHGVLLHHKWAYETNLKWRKPTQHQIVGEKGKTVECLMEPSSSLI